MILILIGALSVAILWLYSKHTQEKYFVEKSIPKYRTPVRIKDGFYYIVPEKEFIELELSSTMNLK